MGIANDWVWHVTFLDSSIPKQTSLWLLAPDPSRWFSPDCLVEPSWEPEGLCEDARNLISKVFFLSRKVFFLSNKVPDNKLHVLFHGNIAWMCMLNRSSTFVVDIFFAYFPMPNSSVKMQSFPSYVNINGSPLTSVRPPVFDFSAIIRSFGGTQSTMPWVCLLAALTVCMCNRRCNGGGGGGGGCGGGRIIHSS